MKILDIANIRSVANRYNGFAKPTLFVVNITPPASMANDGIVKDLMFFCSTVDTPGISFGTDNYMHKGYGLEDKRATSVMIDDINCSFIIDNKHAVVNFFHKWAQKMFNFDHTTPSSTSQGTANESFGYPVDTWGTMNIFMYDSATDQIAAYTVDKVQPAGVPSTQLGWELVDSLMILPMSFTCRSFSTNSTATNSISDNAAIDALSQAQAALTQINNTQYAPNTAAQTVQNLVNTASQYL